MVKFNYRVSVRIGDHQFHKTFEYEAPALGCFESIASIPDVAIEKDTATVASEATVADVTITRFPVRLDVGNPNR